jgi:hypothetical protein
MSLDATMAEIGRILKSGGTGPYNPTPPEKAQLRAFAMNAGALHDDLMSMYPPDKIKNAGDLYAQVARQVESFSEAAGLDAISKSTLLQTLSVIRVPDESSALQQLELLSQQAQKEESVHPLVLAALSIGLSSAKANSAINRKAATASSGGVTANPLAAWHWGLAIMIGCGLLGAATGAAAIGVAAGLVNSSVASCVAAAAGG